MMQIGIRACVAVSVLIVIGCESVPDGAMELGGPSVLVSYQSDPLADVEVSLHASATGPALAKAISGSDGQARFGELPSPEPDQYFVSLQSLGDGGWLLDSDFATAADSGLRLKPFAFNAQQTIKLPGDAVQPLELGRRR